MVPGETANRTVYRMSIDHSRATSFRRKAISYYYFSKVNCQGQARDLPMFARVSGRPVATESAVMFCGTNDTINQRLRIQQAFRPADQSYSPVARRQCTYCLAYVLYSLQVPRPSSSPKLELRSAVHSSLLCSFRTFPVVTFQFFTKSFQKVPCAVCRGFHLSIRHQVRFCHRSFLRRRCTWRSHCWTSGAANSESASPHSNFV